MDGFQYVVVVAAAVSFFLSLGRDGVSSHIVDYWGLPLLNKSPAKSFVNLTCLVTTTRWVWGLYTK